MLMPALYGFLPCPPTSRTRRAVPPTLGLGGGCLLGTGDALPVQLPTEPCLAVKPVREQSRLSAGSEPALLQAAAESSFMLQHARMAPGTTTPSDAS